MSLWNRINSQPYVDEARERPIHDAFNDALVDTIVVKLLELIQRGRFSDVDRHLALMDSDLYDKVAWRLGL